MSHRAQHVVIIDSQRGSYLAEADIEAEALAGVAAPALVRVSGPEELAGRVEDADAIISWHHVPLTRAVLQRLSRCQGIVRAAVGFDNIDLRCAEERGIPVWNVPDYGTEEVADHTLALILALSRNLAALDRHARAGGWDWRAIGRVRRLRGARLGVVGFGRIGAAVARRAQAFGLAVGFFDPHVPSGVEKAHGVTRYETLGELLDASEIVSLHVPLTPETRGLLGRAELARLASDAILVNTSRGEVIDQEALVERVQRGVGRYGLDVLAGEPHVPELFRGSDRVLLTAHSAFYADAALVELRRKAAIAVRRILTGERPRDLVTFTGKDRHDHA